MRDAFEDQETEGRVVVEEVAVSGEAIGHRQPDSFLDATMDDTSPKVIWLT